jgi:hypothetical protein
MEKTFFDIANQSTNYTSRGIALKNPTYSIAVKISGTFNVDVKLQTSMDNENWVDITGSEKAGLTDTLEIVHFDVNLGNHKFTRVIITRNSGSYDAKGYVN